VVFTDDGCTYKGPDGAVENPVTFTYTNNTDGEEFGIGIVTLKEGYGRSDLEAYQGFGTPGFVDHFVALLYKQPPQKSPWMQAKNTSSFVDATEDRLHLFSLF